MHGETGATAVRWCAVALLVVLGCGGDAPNGMTTGSSLDFGSLRGASPRLADEHFVTMRDGARRPVRSYGSDAPIDLVLLHGSGAHNVYLAELSAKVAEAGVAVVHTPDLRGHGASPERRGDIDYVDQLEDDLADLIASLAAEHPDRKVVLAGHSSGGGLAIRFAGGPHGGSADGYLLFAPYLQHDAPTTRPNSGGWASPRLGRIVALTMLNGIGIRALNDTTVLEFDLPAERRSGLETPTYTFRMMSGINPRHYQRDLAALRGPVLVIVGADDEAFVADRFADVFAEHAPDARVVVIPEVGHLGLVGDDEATALAIAWLRDVPGAETKSREK